MTRPLTLGPRAALLVLLAACALMSFAGWADASHELDNVNLTAEGYEGSAM